MPILVVNVRKAMERIRTALDHGVELTAGRMAEFGRKLILQEGEFRNGVVRDKNQRAGYALVIVIDTFDREIVVPAVFDRRQKGRSRRQRHR